MKVCTNVGDGLEQLSRALNDVGGLAYPTTIRLAVARKGSKRAITEDVQFFGMSAEDVFAAAASIGLLLRANDNGSNDQLLQIATKARTFGCLMVQAKTDSLRIRRAASQRTADTGERGI